MNIQTVDPTEITSLEENLDLKNKKHKCSLICPSFEFLSKAKISTNLVCTVPNCDEIFSQESALNLHLEKHFHKYKIVIIQPLRSTPHVFNATKQKDMLSVLTI